MIHSSYGYTLHEIEQMDDDLLQALAVQQAESLSTAIATKKQTLARLKDILR
jgi:hypothetical protein